MTIRIVVADDHPVTRLGTIAILARDAEMSVVGEAEDGDEAIQRCREIRPNLLLLDIRLPKLDGLQVAQQLRHENDELVILILSAYPDAALVRAGLAAGAAGYALKSAPGAALLDAVHRLMRGEEPVLVDVTMPDDIEFGVFSAQESVVLKYVAEGLTTKEIPRRLDVSTRTVDTYLARIFHKVGASTRTQAVTLARRLGVLCE